jgi:AcrR family transcriptional regulator
MRTTLALSMAWLLFALPARASQSRPLSGRYRPLNGAVNAAGVPDGGHAGAIIGVVTKAEPNEGVRRRELRRDAADNRNRVLAAAATAVRREGAVVPMATVAADAGVGVGTVYRHFPSRESLLTALTHRSFQFVLDAAANAAKTDQLGIDAVRRFLDQTIEHGPDLVLPLHGGPLPSDRETLALQAQVHRTLGSLLRSGQQDGTIRTDVRTADLVAFGALLAQQLPHVPDWNRTAQRLVHIFVAGLAPTSTARQPEG